MKSETERSSAVARRNRSSAIRSVTFVQMTSVRLPSSDMSGSFRGAASGIAGSADRLDNERLAVITMVVLLGRPAAIDATVIGYRWHATASDFAIQRVIRRTSGLAERNVAEAAAFCLSVPMRRLPAHNTNPARPNHASVLDVAALPPVVDQTRGDRSSRSGSARRAAHWSGACRRSLRSRDCSRSLALRRCLQQFPACAASDRLARCALPRAAGR